MQARDDMQISEMVELTNRKSVPKARTTSCDSDICERPGRSSTLSGRSGSAESLLHMHKWLAFLSRSVDCSTRPDRVQSPLPMNVVASRVPGGFEDRALDLRLRALCNERVLLRRSAFVSARHRLGADLSSLPASVRI